MNRREWTVELPQALVAFAGWGLWMVKQIAKENFNELAWKGKRRLCELRARLGRWR